MMVDNRYTGDFDNNNYMFSQQPTNQENNEFFDSAAYGNQNDDEMYNYAPNHVNGQPSPTTGSATSGHPTATIKNPYNIAPDPTNSQPPYRHEANPISSQRQPSNNMPNTNARQDSLLGPLLAELDSLSHQPQQQMPPTHGRNSMSYQSNPARPTDSTHPNNPTMSNAANRTVNDALRNAELYDPFDLNDQQPSDVNGTDMFMPSSNTAAPESYYDQYDPENQFFQNPTYNTSGQTYPSNSRQPPPSHQHSSPPHKRQNPNPFIDRSLPPQQNHEEQDSYRTNPAQTQRGKQQPAAWNQPQRTNVKKSEPPVRGKGTIGSSTTSNSYGGPQASDPSKSSRRSLHQPPTTSKSNHIEKNIEMIKNKENYYHRDPGHKYEDAYFKRKDLQAVNGNYGLESTIPSSNNPRRQTSLPLTINLNTSDNSLNRTLPATFTIPIDGHVNRAGEPISVDIHLHLIDSGNRNQQEQYQTSDQPNWAGNDPLERHIRKLERGLDQVLPTSNPPQRTMAMTSNSANPSASRYEKSTAVTGYSGYSPPNHRRDSHNYSAKGHEDDSYLTTYSKKHAEFKPYTTSDYGRFKKNGGFGARHLGFDAENTIYKEKAERAAKVKEYAQHIEARNRKVLTDTDNQTFSGARLPTDEAKTLRLFGSTQLVKRTKQLSDKSTYSSPLSMTEIVPFVPVRRPTDVLYRPLNAHRPTEVVHPKPPARQPIDVDSQSPRPRRLTEVGSRSPPTRRINEIRSQSPPTRRPAEFLSQPSPVQKRKVKVPPQENFEPIERPHRHSEQYITPVKRIVNPPIKRREQNDDNDSRHASDSENPAQNRMNLRRLSPAKISSPTGQVNSDTFSKRRPLRFDNFLLPDEPIDHLPPEKPRPVQQHQYHEVKPIDNHIHHQVKPTDNHSKNEDESLMQAIRQELTERPLNDDEELVVV